VKQSFLAKNMLRAGRHFLPGHVWHLTHRCHHKSFLLKFACERRCYPRERFFCRLGIADLPIKLAIFSSCSMAVRNRVC
jgi:hypothetical protein